MSQCTLCDDAANPHLTRNALFACNLMCRSPDCCDDQDTDDTATSTSSTSTDSLQQESALQLQDRASSGRQLAGEDDSINSTSPHRTASAAFSFGCLAAASDDSPVLSFGWPVAAAAAEVAAQ